MTAAQPDRAAPLTRFQPNVARSRALFSAYGLEQSDPAAFYGIIAEDSAAHVEHYAPLNGKRILDVGGGPGYFAEAFRRRGATYFALDADAGELTLHGRSPEKGSTILGSGMQLPFHDDSVDIAFSSNVLEHVSEPWTVADEMVRVTRPGGLIFLSYTTWYSPHGGHETWPWHYFGGKRALNRYIRVHGKPPKNVYGENMFAVTVRAGLAWTKRRVADGVVDLLEEFPRYHPRWAYSLVRVPVVRELLTWNLVIVLRKR